MNSIGIIYVIFAYLFGAVPTGYLVTRFTAHQNILLIGWRKTSGSNVFYNVGKWRGVVTIAIDFLKGYLVVVLAVALGLPVFAQVLAALSALIGHNWSIFLRFAGGRGIAIFGGALLAFSWQVFGAVVVLALAGSILVHSSIATLAGLAGSVYFAQVFGATSGAGIFALYAAVPIILKRLSPYRELSFARPRMILNRLLFDNDRAPRWGLSGVLSFLKGGKGVDKGG